MAQFGQFLNGRRTAVLGLIAAVATTIAIAGNAAAGSGDPSASTSPGPPLAPPVGSAAVAPAPHRIAEPALGRVPKVSKRGQHLVMPIDAYETSANDVNLIGLAHEIAARNCMQALGYHNWTASTVLTSKPDDGKESDLLDYLDPATVQHSGYPHTLTDKQGTATAQRHASAATSDALRAFLGSAPQTSSGRSIPPGGCLREGERKVEGTTTQLPADPRLLSAQSKGAAMHDSRMRKASATWSACMAQAGLHYTDPLSAQNDARWGQRPASSAAGDAEKRTAYDDARCQQKINLVGLYKALEMSYQQQYINSNKQRLTASLRVFRTWVDNARKVTAAG